LAKVSIAYTPKSDAIAKVYFVWQCNIPFTIKQNMHTRSANYRVVLVKTWLDGETGVLGRI
jgi:hypothetical protein